MIDIEMKVSQNPDFQRIAFFHHLIFEKRGYMAYKIENCKDGDTDYIIDRLVEYNLSQVPAEQEVLFAHLTRR